MSNVEKKVLARPLALYRKRKRETVPFPKRLMVIRPVADGSKVANFQIQNLIPAVIRTLNVSQSEINPTPPLTSKQVEFICNKMCPNYAPRSFTATALPNVE